MNIDLEFNKRKDSMIRRVEFMRDDLFKIITRIEKAKDDHDLDRILATIPKAYQLK